MKKHSAICRIALWTLAGLMVPAVIVAGVGGPVVTNSTTGTAMPEKLGKGAAPGRFLGLPGTSTDTSGAYWTTVETMPSGGTPGQVAGVVALTATQTVVVTGSQASIATQTYSFTTTETGTGTETITVTGTGTGTQTATGATGTYTYTATSTATSVTQVGDAFAMTGPQAVAVSGTTMAVVTSNGSGSRLFVYDISTVGSPSYLAEASTAAAPYGVAWKGNHILVISSGRMEVFSFTAPSTLSYVTYLSLAYSVAGGHIAVSGNRAYVTFTSTASRMQVIDVTDPTSPSSISSSTVTGDTPEGLAASGSNLFAANAGSADRLESYSISDPNAPTYAGNGAVGNNPAGVAILSTTYALVAQTAATDVYLVNISTPASPSYSATVDVGNAPRGIAVIGGRYAVVTFPAANEIKFYDFAKYAGALTYTGTQTTTNTQTETTTVTLTQTATATTTITQTGTGTGTQTVSGTSVYTSSATGIGTGTGTEWTPVWKPTESVLGSYYLTLFNCEGLCAAAWKTDYIRVPNNGLPSMSTSTSATCSTGTDGLIAEFPVYKGQFTAGVGQVWPAGIWSAFVKASSTGPAAIRVEVWEESEGKWFDFTTEQIVNTYPTVVKGTTMKEQKIPTNDAHDVYFLLYATCTSATPITVTFYSDGLAESRIESPLHTYRQAASQISRAGGGDVEGSLAALEQKPRTSRSAFIPWSAFYNASSLTVGTLGASANGTITQHAVMPDGASISRLQGYLWQCPRDYAGGAITVRPLWMPLAADTNWNHRVSWEAYWMPLRSGGEDYGGIVDIASGGGTAEHWDGDTAWSHYTTDGFTTTAIMLESGYSFTPGTFEWLRIAVGRNHASGTDTYVGDVGFIGLQIDYPSIL